jgi:SAM-dependent methyltransferase
MPETSVVFDRAADFYDETRGFPPGEDLRVGEFIAQAAGLNSETRMIEIGVGTGRIALPLAKHIGLMVGVDLSTLMMQRLFQKKAAYDGNTVKLVQGDVMHLPLESHSFDAALIVHILHLVPEPERAVAELARVLRPNGKALQCWNERDESYFEPLWKAWDEAINGERQTQDSWKSSKMLIGNMDWLQLGDEYVYHYTMSMSPEEMADRYRNRVYSSMWHMPDEVWQAGVAALEEALKSSYPDPEQKHDIPCRFHMRVYTPPLLS